MKFVIVQNIVTSALTDSRKTLGRFYMLNSWAATPSSCQRDEGSDCTNSGVGMCLRRNCVCGSRENFRLRLDVQATAVIMVRTSREIRVRDWLSISGGWVNRRCAKVYGLNTDHDSAHSRVVAWRVCVCLPLYCCSSLLEKRTNDLFLTQSRSIMEPLDLSQLPPELWYQQVKKMPQFGLIMM